MGLSEIGTIIGIFKNLTDIADKADKKTSKENSNEGLSPEFLEWESLMERANRIRRERNLAYRNGNEEKFKRTQSNLEKIMNRIHELEEQGHI